MKATKSGERAFVLLSTVFLILVLGMVLRVALIRIPSAGSYREHGLAGARASQAARSGIDYVVSQLREDPNWVGGGARTVVVDGDGLSVTQEEGNVLGVITSKDGTVSEFRVRFNYQDGSKGGDNRPDPSPEFTFEFPYVSLNNLKADVAKIVPRATGPGHSVENAVTGPFTTPGRSAYIVVEGSAYHSGDKKVTKVVESVFQVAPDRAIADAVLMAGGDIDVNVSSKGALNLSGSYITHATGDLLRIRSKKQVSVTRPGGGAGEIKLRPDVKGEVGRDENRGLRAVYDHDSLREVGESVDDGKDFYNVPWSQAPQPGGTPHNRSTVRIPGGVYVYGESLPLGSGGREIRYYDMTYREYVNQAETLATDPTKGVVLSRDLREVRNSRNLADAPRGLNVEPATVSFMDAKGDKKIQVEGFRWSLHGVDLQVTRSKSDHEGLAVVPRVPQKIDRGESLKTPRIDDRFNPDHMKMNFRETTLGVVGDVHLQGGITASGGTLVSSGDVKIVAGRTMSLQGDSKTEEELLKEFEEMEQGVFGELDGSDVSVDEGRSSTLALNIYSKGDLAVSTYVQRLDRYRNMAFSGLLYTWGDVELIAGRRTATSRGTVKLKGALVAYGGNPENETPGSGGGRVDISGSQVHLNWDPRFLPALTELQPEGTSHFTLRRSLIHELR